MAKESFTWRVLFARLLAALVLVYATYNPEGISFYHCTFQPQPGESGVAAYLHSFTPLKAIAALLLIAGWAVFLQATRRSLGAGGALLVLGLFACTIWAMIYYGAISPHSSKAIAHLILIAISIVLAIGLSWSYVTRKLSGQQDTDNVA